MAKISIIKRINRRLKIEYVKIAYANNDRKYLEKMYEILIGIKPNFDNPKTLNEKLNWLKLNWRDSTAEECVDKYLVRNYLKIKGLDDILVKLYGVYDDPDEINLALLPKKFIVKTNHGSGNMYICKDKDTFNFEKLKTGLRKELNKNIYSLWKEWPYRNIQPKIIIEEFLEDPTHGTILDYKFFCFHGEPKFLYVASDRQNDLKFDFYDLKWHHLPVTQGYPNSDKAIERPKVLGRMIEISQILSGSFPEVRVDLYCVNEKIYFGELTFFHYAGLKAFNPMIYDDIFGSYLDVSNLHEV